MATRVCSAAPAAEGTTLALIEGAKKEGRVVWYTSIDLQLAEKVARSFEQKYAGVTARVERAGAERLFTRIGQEYSAGIHAVDTVSTGDAAQFIAWKRQNMLAPYMPDQVAQFLPPEHRDKDGTFMTARSTLSVIAYNTDLVKRDDAPKSFAELLDPKWKSKIVKGHPSYSGTIITATYQLARELGWDYLEKLSKQNVLQVQSATDTPKKIALGERAVMADGNEYNVLLLKDEKKPVDIVYAAEGTPFIVMPSAILREAPHPNAARLFQNYLFSVEIQQMQSDVGGLRSLHRLVKEKPGRKPLSEIKVMKDDPVAVEAQSEDIKRRYTRIFGV